MSSVMRVSVVALSVVALMFAVLAVVSSMLAVVSSMLAMHRLCRVGNYISADRIACSARIDNGEPEVHTSPDARKVRLVCGG